VTAPSPPQASATKAPRTWRPMVGWTLGMLVVLGLAWFVGAVVVPVWKTRAVVVRCGPDYGSLGWESHLAKAVKELGGHKAAPQRLRLYFVSQTVPSCAKRLRPCCATAGATEYR